MSELPLSNLPLPPTAVQTDSAEAAKRFFNSYYNERITVSSDEIDSSIEFFRSRGFDDSAAESVSTVLLSQAKIDKVNVFTILDTLKGLNNIQLSRVVREILNYNRIRISTLGVRVNNANNIDYELRNVIP